MANKKKEGEKKKRGGRPFHPPDGNFYLRHTRLGDEIPTVDDWREFGGSGAVGVRGDGSLSVDGLSFEVPDERRVTDSEICGI